MIVADKVTDIVGIVAIAWMGAHGVTGYEPYAAATSIAIGAKYLMKR